MKSPRMTTKGKPCTSTPSEEAQPSGGDLPRNRDKSSEYQLSLQRSTNSPLLLPSLRSPCAPTRTQICLRSHIGNEIPSPIPDAPGRQHASRRPLQVPQSRALPDNQQT